MESCTNWERTCHARNDQVLLLNVALTRVTKLKNIFLLKLQFALVEGSLPKNIELFKRASNVRVVEEHFVLLNLFWVLFLMFD